MLSKEDLARIVKDEIENEIRNGEELVEFYYILLDGKIYQVVKYNKEVANGTRSPNDIYAYVNVWSPPSKNFEAFLFHTNYLDVPSIRDVIYFYLRKVGFTITNEHDELPTPNLKYYIDGVFNLVGDNPEYLVVNIYDVDSLAESLHIPQIVQQKLGSQPGKVTYDNVLEIYRSVTNKQPLLAGRTYHDAWYILLKYLMLNDKDYKDEAYKISFAYMNLFPTPYEVCYKWEARRFNETDCLKLELRSFSS